MTYYLLILVTRRSLEQDVIKDTDGDLERVLVAMLQGKRRDKHTAGEVVADCEELYREGEG